MPTPANQWIEDAVARYEGPLILYAQRILGDLARARDVVQETFLKLCRANHSEINGHLAAWLYTACRSSALDVKRKESRMTVLNDETARRFESPQAGPHEALEQADAADHVQQLLQRLPESQREAIVLKFAHGLSYKEIARVTGHSVSNVGYLIHVGIKALRHGVPGASRTGP